MGVQTFWQGLGSCRIALRPQRDGVDSCKPQEQRELEVEAQTKKQMVCRDPLQTKWADSAIAD